MSTELCFCDHVKLTFRQRDQDELQEIIQRETALKEDCRNLRIKLAQQRQKQWYKQPVKKANVNFVKPSAQSPSISRQADCQKVENSIPDVTSLKSLTANTDLPPSKKQKTVSFEVSLLPGLT